MAVQYKSLVEGGFFSSDPFDRRVPVSIRCNNPGAVNGAAWEKTYPGYVDTVETTPGNKTTIFEAPEYGVAVWWELMRRYAKVGADTVGEIITKYGAAKTTRITSSSSASRLATQKPSELISMTTKCS